MKEIKLETLTILAFDLPSGAINPKIEWSRFDDRFSIQYDFDKYQSYTSGSTIMWYKDFGGRKKYPKKGEIELLGKVKELTEESAISIIGEGEDLELATIWKNHNEPYNPHWNAKDSFASLLRAQGIEPNDNTVILIKK